MNDLSDVSGRGPDQLLQPQDVLGRSSDEGRPRVHDGLAPFGTEGVQPLDGHAEDGPRYCHLVAPPRRSRDSPVHRDLPVPFGGHGEPVDGSGEQVLVHPSQQEFSLKFAADKQETGTSNKHPECSGVEV